MLKPAMNVELTNQAIACLGVGPQRAQIVELVTAIDQAEDSTVTYAEWWAAVGSCKSPTQWRDKARALGAHNDTVRGLSLPQLGEFFFSRLQDDGSLASAARQEITL